MAGNEMVRSRESWKQRAVLGNREGGRREEGGWNLEVGGWVGVKQAREVSKEGRRGNLSIWGGLGSLALKTMRRGFSLFFGFFANHEKDIYIFKN